MLENLRKSKQRDLILEIVKDNHIHPTAEWIYGEAKRFIPTIGIATVYRNLNKLVELGEIEKISIPGESDRYDSVMTEHFHIRCRSCGELKDIFPVNEKSFDNVKAAIAEAFNLEPDKFEISETMLSYVCENCSDIENKKQCK